MVVRNTVCILSGLLVLADQLPAAESRVANTTLTVPLEPVVYGYQTENALGSLKFTRPVAVASAPGDANRLFVVEQAGYIHVITNLSAPNKTIFLDISDHVNAAGEGGLLGLAFHPDWRNNRRFFVYYTCATNLPAGYVFYDRVSRFEIDPANPNLAVPNSEQFLLSQLDQASNHNAGDLHFGPDGYLYVATGDEGDGGDSLGNSRLINRDFFSGILRIDVDRPPGSLEPNPHPAIHRDGVGKALYAIPPDNPFIGATTFNGVAIDPGTVRTEFWAVGFRNPWRFSFDSLTGFLYCADVGQDLWEEVNLVNAGGDYGWRLREGLHPYASSQVPPGVAIVDPILEYPHSNGPSIPGGIAQGASISGGVVCRGDRLPQLRGHYVFGDYVSGRIFSFHLDPATRDITDFRQLTGAWNPVGFGVDPSTGDVLIVSLGGWDPLTGTILRLAKTANPVSGTPPPSSLSETGAFAELSALNPQPGIVPYELNVPFWSDYAIKTRWFSIPNLAGTMTFSSAGNWLFPTGTVWIKHFEMELTNGVPASRRRLETRFLVKNNDGVHGFTYKWNAAQTDADLVVEAGQDEQFTVYQPNGDVLREQVWRFPSRSECLQCHTPQGGYALGFNTVQLNRPHNYGDGNGPTNQLAALSGVGYFSAPIPDPASLPALAAAADSSASLEYRVRSFLQSNCVQCHQPGGAAQGHWDARIATPLGNAGLIGGPLVNNAGDPAFRVIAPGDAAHSMLLNRISKRGPGQMPPIGSTELDQADIALVTAWINSLRTGGPQVPTISWSNPARITYGTALGLTQLNATASVPGSFSYSPAAGSVLGAGNGQTLAVTFIPTDTVAYTTAQASVQLNVTPATLTITAENRSKTYGSANPTLTASYAGFANGDTAASLDTPVLLSTSAGSGSPVGGYAISASGAADANYTITHVNGSLSVTPAALTITAQNQSRAYGAANPALTASYTGFVNGDTSASLDSPVLLSNSATSASPVGSYPITASGASDLNYTIVHVNGTLTINPAPLIISADPKSKVEGQPNPPLTASYDRFVNNETPASLDNPVLLSTTATSESPVGSYPIAASGATDANYQISFVPGTLTVEANARFVPLELGQGNRVTIRVTGHPSRTYRIQWSPDLDQWNEFASVTINGTGLGTYVESSAPPPGSRYFRILWP